MKFSTTFLQDYFFSTKIGKKIVVMLQLLKEGASYLKGGLHEAIIIGGGFVYFFGSTRKTCVTSF